uniref:Uncharacterized protein n=1 Tax=Zea mays TaxID=4577 RepID=A0A804P0H0_MAIZE
MTNKLDDPGVSSETSAAADGEIWGTWEELLLACVVQKHRQVAAGEDDGQIGRSRRVVRDLGGGRRRDLGHVGGAPPGVRRAEARHSQLGLRRHGDVVPLPSRRGREPHAYRVPPSLSPPPPSAPRSPTRPPPMSAWRSSACCTSPSSVTRMTRNTGARP